MTNLTIDSTINIQYNSLYENLNKLNNKITKDKELQQKIKNILINNKATSKKNSSIKISPTEKNYPRRDSKLLTLNSNTLKIKLSLEDNNKSPKIEKDNSFFEKRSCTFNCFSKKSMNRCLSSSPKIKTKFQFGFVRQKSINKKKFNNKKFNLLGRDSTLKNNRMKDSTIILTPQKTVKKKKTNLLSQINFNIEKINENLNNPDEFYSNYFQALLDTEKIKEKK